MTTLPISLILVSRRNFTDAAPAAALAPPHAAGPQSGRHAGLGSLLAALLIALVIAAGAAPSAALAGEAHSGPTVLRRSLNGQLGRGGPGASAFVYDITAGKALLSRHASQRHPPASVEKLYTSTTALRLMGPSARLTTTVLGTGQMAAGGVWHGDLYLRGGGDPTFATRSFIARNYEDRGASISTLVHGLVAVDHIHRVTGSVYGDASFLDLRRGDPSTGLAPDYWLFGNLSGLAFNRGQTGSLHGPQAPARYAAHRLLQALRRAGVAVEGRSGAAKTPPGARTLATARSPRLAELLHLMLPPSDNYFAEMLIKDLGALFGRRGSTAAGAGVVRATIAKLGLHPHLIDGSGLARADRTSPIQVVWLLRRLAGTRDGAVLRAALPIAGRTGTLEDRMRGTAAEGRCQAKTGTLEGVSNLAGYCQAADGHLIAFAFFDDGIPLTEAHAIQDQMTVDLAGY